MKLRRCSLIVLGLVSVLLVSAEANAQKGKLKGFDAFATRVMKEWKVPGMAVAVVEDGQVILSKGYGYRDLENKQPVTSKTLFAIGSVTKSMTVTVLGMLSDEGKIDWDQPVQEMLPEFRLHDEVATRQMTPRDLVTHRSGLPRHDLMWYGAAFTREELFNRLRYIEPSHPFRTTFQYQNLMFMTAGYLAGHVAGTTWEDLVREKIFQPLDMTRSNFSVDDMQKSDDFALPYAVLEDDVIKIPYRNIDEIGPAGSVNSCVEEMIRYVDFHINKGKHGDEQLLSETMAEQMQTPQMPMTGTIRYEELGHNSYGMGLFITTYRGHLLIHHGGGIDGFISLLSFMPQKKIGAMILTNMSGNNPVPTIISRNLYDRLLGLDPIDWVGRIKEQEEENETAEADAEDDEYSDRKEGTTPSHDLTDYTGQYEHPGYGIVTIDLADEALNLTFNSFHSPLQHYHYDIFEIPESPMDPLEELKVTFFYNKKGDIDRLAIPLESSVEDIVFQRVVDESLSQKDVLVQFVGQYELGSTIITVDLRGENTLTLTVPGQPTYTLVPTREMNFDLKGMNGFSVEFKKDTHGEIVEVVFYQPNGTFVAKKT
jgi:CubicO group peptidase (beta-lactamase class C family)